MTAAMATPYEVTGAAHVPGAEARTLLRLEGFEGSVAHRARELARALGAVRAGADSATGRIRGRGSATPPPSPGARARSGGSR